jgi:hypothetical protein
MPSPTVSSVAREQARRAPAVLTDRGHATVTLIRFERALAPAHDRPGRGARGCVVSCRMECAPGGRDTGGALSRRP